MKSKKISELTVVEIEDRISLLMIMPDDEVLKYLEHVLDAEYTLSENTEDNKAAELFLSDKRFNKYREMIFKTVEDEDVNFSVERYRSIPRKLRKKIAKKRAKEKKIKKVNKTL